MSNGSVQIGVTGTAQTQSKFDIAFGNSIRVEVPETFAAEHVALATRDCEILAEILKSNPRELGQIVSATTTGKLAEAKEIAEKIGLTEDNFIKQDGGMLAVVIVIAIGCALLLAHD